MAGWYLGLTSRSAAAASSSTDVQKTKLHVIVNQDPVRAAVWSTDEVEGRYIRIRWGNSSHHQHHSLEYRYLTEGARDARAPNVRLVVVGGEAHRRPWNFSK
jgi:hypothetical protein